MSADALPPLLTDEQIRSVWSAMGSFTERDADNRMFARAVEAASRAPLLRRIEDMQAENAELRAEVGAAQASGQELAVRFLETAQKLKEAQAEMEQMESRKDAAYLERNQCVSLIARMAVAMGWRAGVARTAIEGWSEDWHGCVYIELPAGQVSWHFHDSQAYLFAGLPAYTGTWDGHDTPEKYRRVAEPVQAEMERLRAEPDMRHPKIQALIGSRARRCVELQIAESLLDDPAHEISGTDGDYWMSLHDKIVTLQRKVAERDAAPQAAPEREAQPVAWVVCGDKEFTPENEPPNWSMVTTAKARADYWQRKCCLRVREVYLGAAPQAAPAPRRLTDEQIDAACAPGRALRWKNDGRQYDRDTARIVESAVLRLNGLEQP